MKKFICTGFWIYLVIGFPYFVRADNKILEKIFADWKERQKKYRNVIYSAQGFDFHAKARFSDREKRMGFVGDVPSSDLKFEKKVKWVLDFENNRSRREVKGHQFYWGKGGVFFANDQIDVCNGKKMVSSIPKEKNIIPGEVFIAQADFIIQADSFRRYFYLLEDFPMFLGHGHLINNSNSYPDALHLTIPLEKEYFVYVDEGNILDRKCVVIRSAKKNPAHETFEYWVDIKKESAVVRWCLYSGEQLWHKLDIDYQETQWGFLPKKWSLTTFMLPVEKRFRDVDFYEEMKVESFKINSELEETQFNLNPKIGQNIKMDQKDFEVYQLQPDGSLIIKSKPEILQRRGVSFLWVLAIFGFLFLVYLVRVFLKKRILIGKD